MDTFEIHDEEIDVEKIMAQIRENIRNRKGEGVYRGNKDEDTIYQSEKSVCPNIKVQRDIEYINANWDIQNKSYFISSHRPFVGQILVKGRELVHGEVRRYVDPMFWKQSEFNAGVTRIINDNNNRFIVLDGQIDQLRFEVNNEVKDQIHQLQHEFDNRIRRIESQMNKDIEHLQSQIDLMKSSNIYDNLEALGINYFQFENNFRGSSDDIKERQSKFINYFKGCSNVLDIGCGRGEFLTLLKEQGIGGKGIDVDAAMIGHCVSKGLDVDQKDAIMYLESLDDEALDGVFIDQVVEHLEPVYLIRLLTLCAHKMQPGSYIIAETVNPLSFTSFANFYIDLTHIKPVHPATLNYLLESCGFKERETIFISPVPQEERLKKIDLSDSTGFETRELMEAFNNNIEMLNNILYGAQDYAIIGQR
ncbi:methionine biosynthesis protein MetW [Methanolobus sp.]|uniref:methionine biosynthesis protein MetW n=1 Tax=Methanolobus sp. TaxID=1874737 RepID=UPI0025D517D2|nr:methionine biosynthesis protein MetW [Methanolobus sp.]